MSKILNTLQQKFSNIENELKETLFERLDPIRGLSLAILSGTNIILLGPPGVAKSLLVREWTRRISGGKYFEWLLTPHSTPDELLGPVSFSGLKEDRHERVTANKLPEADLAYLDEVFKAQGVLNCLLSILNERVFFNGPQPQKIPLYSVIGSSNEIPESDDGLDAVYDRFHLKYSVPHIKEASNFISMLKTNSIEDVTVITHAEIKKAQQEILTVDTPQSIFTSIYEISKALRADGIVVSDRTYKTSVLVVKAEAWLNGHKSVLEEDLEVIKHMVWYNPNDQKKANRIIMEMVNPVKNEILEIFNGAMELLQKIDSPETNITEALKKGRLAMQELQGIKEKLIKDGRSLDLITETSEKLQKTWSTIVSDKMNVGTTKT